MMLPALPDELWGLVISHLRRPLPRPTGKNDRSSIRQTDLARAMRVNRVYNHYAAPLLYSTVVTDSLPDLAYNLYLGPAAGGIKAKYELLSYTKRLYVEYACRDHAPYELLLRQGRTHFERMAPSAEEVAGLLGAEAEAISVAADNLMELSDLRLETYASGAFLHGQTRLWNMVTRSEAPFPTIIDQNMHAQTVTSEFIAARSPKYFCQRITSGPLAFGSSIWATPSKDPYQHRAHLTPESANDPLPVIFSGSTRWYLEIPPAEPEEEKKRGYSLLCHTLVEHNIDREQVIRDAEEAEEADILKAPSLDICAYIPRSMTTGDNPGKILGSLQVELAKALRKNHMPTSRCTKDKFKIGIVQDGSTCEACGWMPSDLGA